MNTGILYSTLAFISCISLFSVWVRIHSLPESISMRSSFLQILTFFTLFTLTDSIWGLFSFRVINLPALFTTILAYVFYMGTAAASFLWTGFICSILSPRRRTKRMIDTIRWFFFSVQIILIAANITTHSLFSISSDGSLTPQKPLNLLFQLQLLPNLLIVFFSLLLLPQTKNEARKHRFTAAGFICTITLLFCFGQMKYIDIPFCSLGYMVAFVTMYATVITREREKANLQQKRETTRLSSIINALSDDYEAVFYINLETSQYQNIINEIDNGSRIIPMITDSSDFFKDAQARIQEVIHPEDRETVAEYLSRDYILKASETNQPVSLIYRIKNGDDYLYYRMKIAFHQEGDNSKKAIIGVSNVDSQILEKQQATEIINAIGEAYDSIYQIDTKNDTNTVFRHTPRIKDWKKYENQPYTKAFTSFINERVHPDFRDQMLQYANLDFLKKELKEKNIISVFFFVMMPEEEQDQYFEMRIVKPRQYEHDGKIIQTFLIRNELIAKKQREMFITSLSDDYDSVYYGNLDKNRVENIRMTDTYRKNHKLTNVKRFTSFIKNIAEDVHPDDKAAFLNDLSLTNIKDRLSAQKSFYISYRQNINDTIQYYRIKLIRTENWEQESEFLLGTSNVDGLIRQQLSLTEENTRKSSVLNTMAESYESICFIDLDTMTYIPYFGSSYINQWYKTDLYRTDFTRFVHEKVAKEHQKDLLAAISEESVARYRQMSLAANKAVFSQQFRTDFNGTQTYCEFQLIKVDESHGVAVIQNRDAIIRKEYEQKRILAEAKDKAEAASRAKTAFLFNMSHDIRTPMNAIQGFIELAIRNIEDKEKIADYLSKAQTSGGHLLKLINDILDMSRIESGKIIIDPVPTDITAETENLFAILDVSAREKGVELTTDASAIENNYIRSDILHVNQIMLNIVSNAIKYTKPGGKVSFVIQQLAPAENGKASYCFTISDTGIGMSRDFQAHIFEEFARAKNSTQSGVEGTGLGMSIVKRLLDMMNGNIEIESELGRGTIVQVYLTFDIVEGIAKVKEESDSIDESLAGKRLLLVEDNELNREIARDILAFEGIIIEEAEDGSVAVEMVKSHEADYYDYVLMDIQMPYMNGYQATKAIRELKNHDYSKLPIIAMTANAFEDDIKDALAAGMNGHLSKPINVPELMNGLKKMARK